MYDVIVTWSTAVRQWRIHLREKSRHRQSTQTYAAAALLCFRVARSLTRPVGRVGSERVRKFKRMRRWSRWSRDSNLEIWVSYKMLFSLHFMSHLTLCRLMLYIIWRNSYIFYVLGVMWLLTKHCQHPHPRKTVATLARCILVLNASPRCAVAATGGHQP